MEMARKKRDPKKAALAKAILEAYQPETAEDEYSAHSPHRNIQKT